MREQSGGTKHFRKSVKDTAPVVLLEKPHRV